MSQTMVATVPGHTHASLQGLLTQFAQPTDALAQSYSYFPHAPAARLTAVLNLIQEIVLPRKVTFLCDGYEIAEMIIANRRLNAFEQTGNATPEEEETADLAQRLLEFAKDPRTITMQAPTRIPAGISTEQSYSTRALKTALGLDENISPMDHMHRLIDPHATSLLVWSGNCDAPQKTGAENWHETLHDFAQRYIDNLQAEAFEAPVPRGLMLRVTAEQSMLIAVHDGDGVAAILSNAEAHGAIEAWQMANG